MSQNDSGVAMEMPRYKCHKEVHALKIAEIDIQPSGSAIITPAEDGYAEFDVSAEYVRKHNPTVGGYFVIYDDVYQSFSPAAAFESGYTPIVRARWTSLAELNEIPSDDPRWPANERYQLLELPAPICEHRGWLIRATGFKSSPMTIDIVTQVWAGKPGAGLDFILYASSTGGSGKAYRGERFNLDLAADGQVLTQDTLREWVDNGTLGENIGALNGRLFRRVIELIDEAEGAA